MDAFSDKAISFFVDDFEGIKKNWLLIRQTKQFKEYYSLKTATVYQIDNGGYYFKIFFVENRPENIGYGLDADTKKPRAFCKKCNTLIFTGPDMIGRIYNYCNCETGPEN